MANIHIARAETKLGIFPEDEIKEGLRTGRFTPTDLGWREGMTAWRPLAQFPELAGEDTPAATPPLSQTPDVAARRTSWAAVGSSPGPRPFPRFRRNAQTRPAQSHHRFLGHENRGRTQRAPHLCGDRWQCRIRCLFPLQPVHEFIRPHGQSQRARRRPGRRRGRGCFRNLHAGFDRPWPLYRFGHPASVPHPCRWRETAF